MHIQTFTLKEKRGSEEKQTSRGQIPSLFLLWPFSAVCDPHSNPLRSRIGGDSQVWEPSNETPNGGYSILKESQYSRPQPPVCFLLGDNTSPPTCQGSREE